VHPHYCQRLFLRLIRLESTGGGPAVADLLSNLDDTVSERLDCLYSLRPKRHDRVLPIRCDNRNFFDRHLFKDMY